MIVETARGRVVFPHQAPLWLFNSEQPTCHAMAKRGGGNPRNQPLGDLVQSAGQQCERLKGEQSGKACHRSARREPYEHPQCGPGLPRARRLLTGGQAFSAVPFDPTKITRKDAGTATFAFTDGNTGIFSYNVDLGDGVNRATQSKAITRQVFRAPGTVCQ